MSVVKTLINWNSGQQNLQDFRAFSLPVETDETVRNLVRNPKLEFDIL